MSENALVTMDQALLQELTGMVRTEEIAGADAGPAVLKMNYDEESVHGTGVWIVGQKSKGGVITDQGVPVNSVIILTTRLQHSYYDEKNPQNSFSSMMFDWGGKAPDKAAFDAKLVSIGKPDKGRFRIVCFGLAVLPDGSTVDCVSYISGTSYMGFKTYYDSITRQKVNGNWADLPPFVCVTHLPTPDREKNGSRTYYIGKFEKGPFLQRDMILACGEKRELCFDFIDKLNANPDLGKAQQPAPAAPQPPPQQQQYAAPPQQQYAAPPQGPPPQQQYAAPPQGPPPQQQYAAPGMPTSINQMPVNLEGMKQANATVSQPSVGDDVPFNLGGANDIGDLEEAIRAAL